MARILICDDSEFMRNKIRDILENNNHQVVGEAKDGVDAVEKFKKLKPDLVTMDILMKISGTLAIKEIIKIDPNARIIIISIMDDHQADIIENIKMGVQGYVAKPVKAEVLISEIERVLAK